MRHSASTTSTNKPITSRWKESNTNRSSNAFPKSAKTTTASPWKKDKTGSTASNDTSNSSKFGVNLKATKKSSTTTTTTSPWNKEKTGSTTDVVPNEKNNNNKFGGVVNLKKTKSPTSNKKTKASSSSSAKPSSPKKKKDKKVKAKKASNANDDDDALNNTLSPVKKKKKKDKNKVATTAKKAALNADDGGDDDSVETMMLRAAMSKLQDNKSLEPQVKQYIDRINKAGGYPLQRRRLSVRDNDLVTTLVKVINNDPSVTSVNIQDDPRFQHVSNALLLDFAQAIRTNWHLETLKINKVELGNAFLSALSTSMESNFTLEHIDLAHNSFTSDALLEFCQAMAVNDTVTHVDLRHQHAPIPKSSTEVVLESLRTNLSIKTFRIDLRASERTKEVDKIVQQKKGKTKKSSTDKKLLDFLEKEAARAEELVAQQQVEAKLQEKAIEDGEWSYLIELSGRANKYQLYEATSQDDDKKDDSVSHDFLPPPSRKNVAQALAGSMVNYTNDGSFLTDEFISSYLVQDPETSSLMFAFQNQTKLFKRFGIGDPKRRLISQKFADALVHHPRSNEITHINMANSCCGDEWLVQLSENCVADPKLLPQLHLINLETNFVGEAGIVALSKCIANTSSWKYLQAIKLENQRHLISSKAELALAKALCVNRSVIRLSLRVRNLWEKDKINKFVSRNMDLLRQARLKHAEQTGTKTQRARNTMEQLFDRVAANDAELTTVDVVGNQVFLSLPQDERVKAAKSFATNDHVKTVKMSMLKVDDEFACALASSIMKNSSIEKICLDSNSIGSKGIAAIVGSLSKNSSITELQFRHQSKAMATSEEEALTGLLGDNTTIAKLGVDLRSIRARNELDRKLTKNRELQRMARQKGRADKKGETSAKAGGKMQQLFHKIGENDPEIETVQLVGDNLFLSLGKEDKLQAAASFANNTHVTDVKLSMLKLDDAFVQALAKSIECNSCITKLVLDSNMIGSDGITSLVASLSKNTNIVELQVRHQSKPMATKDEEELAGLLGNNESLVKLGVDLRSPRAQREIETKLARNRDLQRKKRAAAKKQQS